MSFTLVLTCLSYPKSRYVRTRVHRVIETLMQIIDKHAPIKRQQTSKKNSPWTTYETRKGRTIRKVMVSKFLGLIFFRPWHEHFLGFIGVHEFFSFNFPLRVFFFCTSPPPHPHKFSNGPSLRSTRGRLAGLKFEKIAESFCHFGFRIYNVVVNLNSGDASFLTIAVADEVPQQKYLTEKTEAIWTTSFKRTTKIEVTERLIRQCAPVNVNPQVKCDIFLAEGPRMGQSFKCSILVNSSVILVTS